MKRHWIRRVKKAGAIVLSLLIFSSSLYSSQMGKLSVPEVNVIADEGSATISMSNIMNKNKISELDRDADEGLWKMSAGGKTAFCLNSGKSMCNGDTVKYKTANAVTYKKQGIAKVLTYYYWKSSKSDRAFALTQAYIWACGAGKDKQKTIYQVGKNLDSGFSNKDAKVFCEKINNTDPKGKIYYYIVTHCVKGKKHDNHQTLYGMTKETVTPETDKISYSDQASEEHKMKISIRKCDQKTKAVLSGAKFEFFRDDKSVGTAVTGEDGTASFIYKENLKTQTKKVTKQYIKNWNELAKDQQQDYTKKGYYDSKAKALQAAKKEVQVQLENLIKDQKSQSHTWKVKEIEAPHGYELDSTQKTVKKTSDTTEVDFGDFYNKEKKFRIEINKKSTIEDFGTDATYANAQYGVYAKTDILESDGKTILYKKDDKVTTIITDANGYGSAQDLLQGEYYLKEEKPPEGFKLNEARISVTLDQDKIITVYDSPYMGKLRIHKTYDNDKKNESGAVFEVYNSKKQLVDTITTGTDGMAVTKELPYGSYVLHQVKGTKGFSKIPDMTKDIGKTEDVIEININNPREAARILITKTILISDIQAAVNKKKPEAGAQFEIIRKSDQKVVDTITTDVNGYAASDMLDPGTYTVHQIKGADNYDFIKDFDVTIKDGDYSDHSYVLNDVWNGKKLMIKKTKQKNKIEEPEADAEFVVLDKSKVTGFSKADLGSEQSRKQYIDSLPKDAVIERLTTDSKGTAQTLLEDLKEDSGFLVIQVKGEEGYDLAPVYDSKDYKAQEINGIKVYKFTAKDHYLDEASIKIVKRKRISATETSLEAGAVFELRDLYGNVVKALTTGSDGTAQAENIAVGTYILHQTKGSKEHEMIEDQVIVLSKKDKGKIVRFEYENKEKDIDFILSKRSEETKKLLNGATYAIYDEAGNEKAVLVTGSMKEGYATCKLPYGKYTIKELKAPDGYNKNENVKNFRLDLKGVSYDTQGNGSYHFEDVDEPVYGSISLRKTGEVLSGYDNGFIYENDLINGAVYELYAKEDIKRDDGSIVWKAGTLIDQKTTKDGVIKFTRIGSDGKQTEKFYQGVYYIKEISGPNGYCIDTQEHEVVINWDTKPGDMNEIGKTEDVPNVEPPHGNDTSYPSSGKYVLETGSSLNARIKDAKNVIFTWESAPSGVSLMDVSQNKDQSVAAWKAGSDYYISSQKAGQVIYMNALSSKMFSGCKNLTNIRFKNIDTSAVVDMSEMFYACDKIRQLDLSSFNTSNVKDVRKMFYGCSALKRAYVQDQIVKSDSDDKEAAQTKLSASAKTVFCVGDTYHAKDFIFSGIYDDGGIKDLTDITDNDIQFIPQTAVQAGNQKITIVFKNTGKYKGYEPIEVMVKVIDPENTEDVPTETERFIEINIEVSDILQKYGIHLIKTDKAGNKLAGAQFALKAACEIVNKDGKPLFHEGDIIATAVSEDDQFGYIEFFGLPAGIYAKDGIGKKMYVVEEIKAPLGYKNSNEKITYGGQILNNKTEDFIHDTVSEGNQNDSEKTYIHDSKVWINDKSDKITIKKYWVDADNAMNTRPGSITVKAVNDQTKEVKSYILNKNNDWQVESDIDASQKDNYTFEEIFNAPGYVRISKESGEWNGSTYVLSYINRYTDQMAVKIIIKKVWEDGDDSDKIRPSSVKVWLYKNGTKTDQSYTLNAGNHWTATFSGLDRMDETGEKINYEVREEETSIVNGDAKTGYETSYDVSEKTDTINKITTITSNIINTHHPAKGSVRLKKKDVSGNVLKGVKFQLRSSDGNLSVTKETNSKGEVLFDELEAGTYTITEIKTKEGMNLLKEPLNIKIPVSMTQKEAQDKKADISKAVKRGSTYYFYDLTYEITNEAKLNLPKTGGSNTARTYLPMIGGFLLIFFSLFYNYFKKKS